MAKVCKRPKTPRTPRFQIFAGLFGIVGSTLALLQFSGVLTIAEESIIKTPSDPSVSILALALFVVSFMLLNRKRR